MIYNDYYLLYLISLHNESAFDVLYEKYLPLIKKCISSLKLTSSEDVDNYAMEADNMFVKAVYTYDQDLSNKTFTRYFELILLRRFNYLRHLDYRREAMFVPFEESYMLEEEPTYPNEGVSIELDLSDFEEQVYHLMIKGLNSRDIAEVLKAKPKQVYNATQRIRSKLMDHRSSIK